MCSTKCVPCWLITLRGIITTHLFHYSLPDRRWTYTSRSNQLKFDLRGKQFFLIRFIGRPTCRDSSDGVELVYRKKLLGGRAVIGIVLCTRLPLSSAGAAVVLKSCRNSFLNRLAVALGSNLKLVPGAFCILASLHRTEWSYIAASPTFFGKIQHSS